MTDAEARKHLYLVDGSGYIFRAFFAVRPLNRPDGTPVNAVFGYTNMLVKLIQDTGADYLAVVFDTARQSFRNEIYSEYKAHRPPPPPELVPQFELIRSATRAWNVPSVELAGFEADDLIATYAHQAVERGFDVTIVSSDKDLMQLVRPGVRMLDPIKNLIIGADEVQEKFGVRPDRVIDVQALMGDSTDNVPGVPGIGPKIASSLVQEYGDLDRVLAEAPNMKRSKRRDMLIEHADLARISRRLVTLRRDAPVEHEIEAFQLGTPDPSVLVPFLEEQGFRRLLETVKARFDFRGEPAAIDKPSSVEPSYRLVVEESDLTAWVERVEAAGLVAVDTETTSLNPLEADLVGISLSVEPGEACYIPVGHVARHGAGNKELDLGDSAVESTPRQLALETVLQLLQPMLEDEGILKIGHNIKYDMHVLARYGIAVGPVDDTMLLSYVLGAGLRNHGLDELAGELFNHNTIKYSEVTGTGRSRIGFEEVAPEAARDYAAEDAEVTLRFHHRLKPKLTTDRMVRVYETLERPLLPVLLEMERDGILVDAGELRELSEDFGRRSGKIERRIHELAGENFNIGSPRQLGQILFEKLKLPGSKRTRTGLYSTDADVLEDLAAEGDHELPGLVMDWRQFNKLKGTYTDALAGQINPDTGRVHTSYSQVAAATGRLSSNDPNLQNIPVRTDEGRRIRRAFVAREGCVLLSADYSQIELRLLAHVADIEVLRDAFRDGADIHAMTASEVFGVPVEGMPPAVRSRAKAINFGIIYGISAFGLSRQLRIPRRQAQDYIDNYFEKFPGIRTYMEDTIQGARNRGGADGKQGFVETMFGRRCHTPNISDRNAARRRFSERAAINAPLQGAAADIIKRAMIRIPPALEAAGLQARMLLQVHDELIFEVPEAELEKTSELVCMIMGSAAQLHVPLVVDTGHGANWDEAH